jgi:DNA-binding response OmpR family regulator
MGTQLELDKNEFDVLDILATNEGQFMTNRQIYKAAWGTPETDEYENITHVVIESLIEQVNSVCGEFMWIESIPELGYTLRTRWGNNWQRNSFIEMHLSNLIGV